MPKIKIDLEGLSANSTVLQQQIDEMNALNGRLSSMTQEIASSWEGAASDAYVAMMAGYSERAAAMRGVMEAYKHYVDAAIIKFREVDQKCASAIRNSF